MTVKTSIRNSLLALACVAAMGAPALAQNKPPQAAPVVNAAAATADFDQKVQVAGQTLVLNGEGRRYFAIIPVYRAALYAPAKVTTAEQFLTMPGVKRIELRTLRDISGDTLGNAMVEGMQANATPSEKVGLIQYMDLLGKMFGAEREIPKSSVLTVDFVPGKGTLMTLNGVLKGEAVADPMVFALTAKIWLGDKPVDQFLKDALLGKPRNPNNPVGG
jgi:hypothetical protein